MAQRQRRRLARLCDLAAGSLLPHLEPKPRLTREDERRILLALSRVNKIIRGWEVDDEQGCGLGQEIIPCSGKVHSCCLPPDQHFDDRFSCLANIVSILVGFLGFSNDYIKHSAGNILIAISISLMKFETVWIQFIELLWAAIHTVSVCVHNALSHTNGSTNCFEERSIHCYSVVEALNSDVAISSTCITSFMAVLQLRCPNISGQMMASLFRVLHAILKFLKHNSCELKCDFICSSIHYIQKIGWDSYYKLNASDFVSRAKDGRFNLSNDSAKLRILSGNLLQLLCSLVEPSDLGDTDGQHMYAKIVDVIPKLAAFLQEQHGVPKSLSEYSRHKLLMVMMRLKPYMFQDCSHIICWLKLLRQHFQDLLTEPMFLNIAKAENCLEGSPFLSSIVGLGEIHRKSTRHLQRQVTYLFLSCCMCLASKGNNNGLKCSCKKDDHTFGHKVQGCIDHCNCFGLLEISDWFQRCCLHKVFDSKSSTDIALCFVQLYMEEDDMLFNILLELLDAPVISVKMDSMQTELASELIGAKLFSSIFDPVHTLHLLLFLLHYDHLVLIDYLISKDVGVLCAQYLLRCLRLVFQCWHAFVDDSIYEANIGKLNCKRLRTFKDINSIGGSSEESPKLSSTYDTERENKQQLFLNAKVCLSSLRSTVDDLHKKGLFPYNPKPLLKSLARFEEFCEHG